MWEKRAWPAAENMGEWSAHVSLPVQQCIKVQFEATLAQLAKTRLSSVSKEVRAKAEKPKKKPKKKDKK